MRISPGSGMLSMTHFSWGFFLDKSVKISYQHYPTNWLPPSTEMQTHCVSCPKAIDCADFTGNYYRDPLIFPEQFSWRCLLILRLNPKNGVLSIKNLAPPTAGRSNGNGSKNILVSNGDNLCCGNAYNGCQGWADRRWCLVLCKPFMYYNRGFPQWLT